MFKTSMSHTLEQNFVVFGSFAFEDGEDQPTIKFQIKVEKLLEEEDLLVNGLINYSSGIKTEYISRSYVVNENLAYYFHETISIYF